MTKIAEQYIIHALDSKEQFPIDFNEVWKTAGYKRKDYALDFFNSLGGLEKGVHYSGRYRKSNTGGRSSETFGMTVDAYKFFLSKSNTTEGDSNLWYLIAIEKKHRQDLERQFAQPVPTTDFNKVRVAEEKIESLEFEVKRLAASNEKLTADITRLTTMLNTAKSRLEIAERNQRSTQWESAITEDDASFTYDADYLFLISGIACRKYFIAKLFENFILSEDFIKEPYAKSKHGEFHLGKDKYFTNAKTALATVINHRSKAGISKRELPSMYHFLFDQIREGNNTNRRHLRAR